MGDQELWNDIGLELIRIRQRLSCPRDLRRLGPSDPYLSPRLFDVVQRYTRGLCVDFAVRLASANEELKLAGFYAGSSLVHAFVVDGGGSCLEVSGIWTAREMKALHADDGRFKLLYPPLDEVLEDMENNAAAGAVFDSLEVVLSVSGCLPHLREFVPEPYVAPDPREALVRLDEMRQTRYSHPPSAVSGLSRTAP